MSIFTFAAVDTASIHVVATELLTLFSLTLWHSSLKWTIFLNKKNKAKITGIIRTSETSRDTTEQQSSYGNTSLITP